MVGVGGAGGNAVNNMIRSNLDGCEFVVCNTDAQAMQQSLAERRIQLGVGVTRGLGAGSRPEVGRSAAEEALEEIMSSLEGSNMVFITAGMGGGTGTGAAPVIARAAREAGILTVGVVTKPFQFEGTHRMRIAEPGIQELQKYVDTLIIIPNQNLFRVANERTTFADAFKMADDVLHSGVRGVTDLMVMPGLINLDFADIRAVMSEMGKAMMGTGEAEGDRRAIDAAEAAISNPLLDDVSMKGARGVLINITGGLDMTLFEVDEAANRIREEVDPDANIIFGSTFDEKLAGKMRISVVATGIDAVEVTSRRPVIQLVTENDRAERVRHRRRAGSRGSDAGAGAGTRGGAHGRRRARRGRRANRSWRRRHRKWPADVPPMSPNLPWRPIPMPRRRWRMAGGHPSNRPGRGPPARRASSSASRMSASAAPAEPELNAWNQPSAATPAAGPGSTAARLGRPDATAFCRPRKRRCWTSRPSCAARRTDVTRPLRFGPGSNPSWAVFLILSY